jgi:hypothetical protein
MAMARDDAGVPHGRHILADIDAIFAPSLGHVLEPISKLLAAVDPI